MPHRAVEGRIAAGWVAALPGRFPSNRFGALVAVYLLAYVLTIGVAISGLRALAAWLGPRRRADLLPTLAALLVIPMSEGKLPARESR
jgi:hypothetical protein